METIKVNPDFFEGKIPKPYHVFNSCSFIELNKEKCDNVDYLVSFKNGKVYLGWVFGHKDNFIYSPFSAPFGGPIFVDEFISLENIDSSIESLCLYYKEKRKNIQLTLPPLFYNSFFLSKVISSFYRKKFTIKKIDVNHFFYTKRVENYNNHIWRNAKKNLKISKSKNLSFFHIGDEDIENKSKVYELIKVNRSAKGYPLHLSKEDVLATSQIIKSYFFLLLHEDCAIASAIIFRITKSIVQVIYWGDNPIYSHLKPMNYLSFKIFDFFAKEDAIEIIDIGPSSKDSSPNYGLSNFKESIGCSMELKFTLEIAL